MRDLAILGYFWVSLWLAVIAAKHPDAPKNLVGRFLGSVVIGIIWPITLPFHAILDDFKSDKAEKRDA